MQAKNRFTGVIISAAEDVIARLGPEWVTPAEPEPKKPPARRTTARKRPST